MRKICNANTNQKKVEAVNLRARKLSVLKGNNKGDLTVLRLHEPNMRASKYTTKILKSWIVNKNKLNINWTFWMAQW